MSYSIGNTVFATTNNNPFASAAKRWIGVVKRVTADECGYDCLTIYSDDKDAIGKVVGVRFTDLNRYQIRIGDTVKILDGDWKDKVLRVTERYDSSDIHVVDNDEERSYGWRHLELVSPRYARTDVLPLGSIVKSKAHYDLPANLAVGTKGTVVANNVGEDPLYYGIEWENYTGGHNCNGKCTAGNSGWFCTADSFDVVEKAAETAAPAAPVNNTKFLVGDIVRGRADRSNWLSLGEVVAIDGNMLSIKLHHTRNGKIVNGAVVEDICSYYSASSWTYTYITDSDDNFVLVKRGDVLYCKDLYTGDDVDINNGGHVVGDGALYDKDANVGYPAYVTESTYAEYAYTCALCGEVHLEVFNSSTNVVDADGNTVKYCPKCRRNHTFTCDRCGTVYAEDASETENCQEVYVGADDDGSEVETWCGCCIESDAEWCEEHEHYYNSDYGCPICGRRGRINSYSYKPDPVFTKVADESVGDKTFYYGVEDETEGRSSEPSKFSKQLGQTTKEVYCKHDGSLNNGAEVVTHPCTLRYHLESDMWDRVAAAAAEHGMKSHDTDTCGLHVHMSRKPFEAAGIEDYEDKLTLAYDRFKGYWKAISRRRDGGSRWGRFLSDKRNEKTNTKLDDVKKKKDRYDRYQAVNLCNEHTVEIRIFRGTLKVSTIKATLWLVDAVNRFIMDGGDLETCTFYQMIDMEHAPDFVKEYLSARDIPVV